MDLCTEWFTTDLPKVDSRLFQWYMCEELPASHLFRWGLAWLAQQPAGASCTMLEAKSNQWFRERFDDASDPYGEWLLENPWNHKLAKITGMFWQFELGDQGPKVRVSSNFLSDGSVVCSTYVIILVERCACLCSHKTCALGMQWSQGWWGLGAWNAPRVIPRMHLECNSVLEVFWDALGTRFWNALGTQ